MSTGILDTLKDIFSGLGGDNVDGTMDFIKEHQGLVIAAIAIIGMLSGASGNNGTISKIFGGVKGGGKWSLLAMGAYAAVNYFFGGDAPAQDLEIEPTLDL